jgi:hypothetical protein
MQTLYRLATELGAETPTGLRSWVQTDALERSHPARRPIRGHVSAFLVSVTSARAGFGD